MKDNNSDERLPGLGSSQTEQIKAQKEDWLLAVLRTEMQKQSEKAQQGMKKNFDRRT